MKNVVVIAVGSQRHAIELRWVQEIFSLVHLTPVPSGPPGIAGAANLRGSIVTVLAAGPLVAVATGHDPGGRAPGPGTAVLVLDIDGVRAGLAVDRIDEVTTLDEVDGEAATTGAETEWSTAGTTAGGCRLLDRERREVLLLDAPAILELARRQVAAAAEAAGARNVP